MVILVLFAIVGILTVLCSLYYLISKKFPKAGNKIDNAIDSVVSKFNKNKDSETVSDLDKLDK